MTTDCCHWIRDADGTETQIPGCMGGAANLHRGSPAEGAGGEDVERRGWMTVRENYRWWTGSERTSRIIARELRGKWSSEYDATSIEHRALVGFTNDLSIEEIAEALQISRRKACALLQSLVRELYHDACERGATITQHRQGSTRSETALLPLDALIDGWPREDVLPGAALSGPSDIFSRLPGRVRNALKSVGIDNDNAAAWLVDSGRDKALKRIPNFGEKSLTALRAAYGAGGPDAKVEPTDKRPPAHRVDRRWLTVGEVAHRYSCSRVTVYRLVKAGQIPAPVRFSPGMSRWDALALDAADARR